MDGSQQAAPSSASAGSHDPGADDIIALAQSYSAVDGRGIFWAVNLYLMMAQRVDLQDPEGRHESVA